MQQRKPDRLKAAEIVRDAGGQIVGRTKLQKVAFLLELAGFGDGFRFEYRHYGPYSEELATAIQVAEAFGLVTQEERTASWGGTYSIYTVKDEIGSRPRDARSAFAQETAKMDAIELELAATAAYLSGVEQYDDPWIETERRKPEKASEGRLARAKAAYRKLLALQTPKQLPNIL